LSSSSSSSSSSMDIKISCYLLFCVFVCRYEPCANRALCFRRISHVFPTSPVRSPQWPPPFANPECLDAIS
jgi:hypothetical protein